MIEDILSLLLTLSEKALHGEIAGRVEAWIIILLCIAALLMVIIWAFFEGCEKVIKIVEYIRKDGLLFFASSEDKVKAKRRAVFGRVLRSDLDAIGKSESWNDQEFTDLEAKVEIEGKYFPTRSSKLWGVLSEGRRNMPSLMKAIESSAEQFLLLVGEPGAGKSIALRHLALQLAERMIKSDAGDVQVPLYINLRELEESQYKRLTVDALKKFVVDNVRRGSADTAAFVTEHWDEYVHNGCWFFLFDSFDEIPEVLHADASEEVIAKYSGAISRFLGSVGSCRAIVASREFKCPDDLDWKRIRILPLDFERQESLIRNSFMPIELKDVARRHIASSRSTLAQNPLFLTLLCRHIKTYKQPPLNEHELLGKHIHTLANRESDYLRRRYQLTAAQIRRGAIELATLFATQPTLSLAPTKKDLTARIKPGTLLAERTEDVLAALVDVKIARVDHKESRAGEQRFAFSHRRYQEALFVEALVSDDSPISTEELLSDQRWREYLVALLQSQSRDLLKPIVAVAQARFLHIPPCKEKRAAIGKGASVGYYDWSNCDRRRLLSALQEGLSDRPDVVPESFVEAIETFLHERFETGNLYDQYMVVRHCGTARIAQKLPWLELAVASRSERMQVAAFEQIALLRAIPVTFCEFILRQISDQIIFAPTKQEVLKVEAIASRIEPVIACRRVVARAVLLRQSFRTVLRSAGFAKDSLAKGYESKNPAYMTGPRRAYVIPMTAIYAMFVPLMLMGIKSDANAVLASVKIFMSAVATSLSLIMLMMFWVRCEPMVVGPKLIAKKLFGLVKWWASNIRFVVALVLAAVVFVPAWIGAYVLKWIEVGSSFYVRLTISGAFIFCVVIVMTIVAELRSSADKQETFRKLGPDSGSGVAKLLLADDAVTVESWIMKHSAEWHFEFGELRALLELLRLVSRAKAVADYEERTLIKYCARNRKEIPAIECLVLELALMSQLELQVDRV